MATEVGGGATRRARLVAALTAGAAPEGLAVFRILFGALMLGAVVRCAARGWIDELYIAPDFHFTYLGFTWVKPWPAWGMYLHFALLGLSALALMLGYRTRLSAALFFVLFGYLELCDKTTYLNHYYFISLAAFLCVLLPTGAAFSLDARRHGRRPVGAWVYWVLRAQVAVVYIFAGCAKLDADWLLRAEPLRSWLVAHAGAPVVGPLLALPATAFVLSWGGTLFDLSIPLWLAWPRTRAYAYVVAAGFHVTIWLLFPIGMFSWIMLAAGTVFFAPDWPVRFARRLATRIRGRVAASAALASDATLPVDRPARPGRVLGTVLAAYFALQILLPLRHFLYPGTVNWTEEGFRFAWRVMLVEKTGEVEFEVQRRDGSERLRVYPRRELTAFQYRQMATQPDMIHEYARFLAERYGGSERVRVYAHAFASLNGRPSQRLVDPEVDLGAEAPSLGSKDWLVPLVAAAPRALRARFAPDP